MGAATAPGHNSKRAKLKPIARTWCVPSVKPTQHTPRAANKPASTQHPSPAPASSRSRRLRNAHTKQGAATPHITGPAPTPAHMPLPTNTHREARVQQRQRQRGRHAPERAGQQRHQPPPEVRHQRGQPPARAPRNVRVLQRGHHDARVLARRVGGRLAQVERVEAGLAPEVVQLLRQAVRHACGGGNRGG